MKLRLVASLLALVVGLTSCETKTKAAPRTAAAHTAVAPKHPASANIRWAQARTTKPRALRVVATNGFVEHVEREGGAFAAHGVNDGVSFAGTDRKAAKITIASAPAEHIALADLVAELSAQENAMLHHNPAIAKNAGSGRVVEEQRNVTVDGWIHFAKKESDNDYHVILGSTDDPSEAVLMNVEVSGLPPHNSTAFAKLSSARTAFEDTFLDSLHSGGSYTQFEPVHVRITGSLFFDIDHAAGVVGPNNFRPQTAWEIHPVTKIVFAN